MNRLLSVLIFALYLVGFNPVAGVAEHLPGKRCHLQDPYQERTNCRGSWNFKSPEGKYFGNYNGGWKNGKFHGLGKWVGSNGKVIKANWNQGVARRSEDPEVFYCPLDFSYCSVIFNEKLNVILGISKDIPKPEPEPIIVKPASNSNFDKKIALVIGNSKYLNTVQLLNPQKDAKAVADKLTQMGFEVNLALDLNDRDMENLIADFSDEVSSVDLALFYYAGHGFQLNGTNYLMPIDAGLKSENKTKVENIAVDLVLEYLNGAKKLGIVLIDACRSNPLFTRMPRKSASRSNSTGLAHIEKAGKNLIISFAAEPGMEALDGLNSEPNSPYATAVIELIGRDQDISLTFRQIRGRVEELTDGQQMPMYEDYTSGSDPYILIR